MNKWICFAFLIFFTAQPQARQFHFHEMATYQNRRATWQLSSMKQQEFYAILDCQSLFHKLDLYSTDKVLLHENYLNIELCGAARDFFTQCLSQHGEICLDTEDIYKSECDCQIK